jgi:hypothetical protein
MPEPLRVDTDSLSSAAAGCADLAETLSGAGAAFPGTGPEAQPSTAVLATLLADAASDRAALLARVTATGTTLTVARNTYTNTDEGEAGNFGAQVG